MVTEVMHLHIAVNVYLDGGKLSTSVGFHIKDASLWWRVLIIANCWDEGIEFSSTKDATLEWKLRKSPGYHSSCISTRLITKDGSHSSYKDLWVSCFKHMCKGGGDEMNMMKMKSAKVYLLFNLIVRVLSYSWIHPFQLLVSLFLCWEVYNTSRMTVNLLCSWKTFPAGCKNLLMEPTKETLKDIGIRADGDIILTNSLQVGGRDRGISSLLINNDIPGVQHLTRKMLLAQIPSLLLCMYQTLIFWQDVANSKDVRRVGEPWKSICIVLGILH